MSAVDEVRGRVERGEPDAQAALARARVDQVEPRAEVLPHAAVHVADRQRVAAGREAHVLDQPALDRVRRPDRLPRRRVVDDDVADVVADRHQLPVGADRGPVDAEDVIDGAEHRRRVLEHGQQAALRGGRLVEVDGRAREQQRLVEAVQVARLDAQPLGVGGERGVARLAALVERDDAGRQREHEQSRRGRRAARAAGGSCAARARPRPRPRRGSRRGTRARAR